IQRGDEPTTYQLRFQDPVFENRRGGSPKIGEARLRKLETQETGLQETVEQDTVSKYLPHSSEDISSSNRLLTHELLERREEESEPPAVEPASRMGFATAGALLKQRFQAPEPAEQTIPGDSPAQKRGRPS